MDTIFNFLRRGLVLTLVLMFAFVFTYVPQRFNEVPLAEAQIPVIDAAVFNVNMIMAAAQMGLVQKEMVLDVILYAVAKTIISSLITTLINWVNSGFKGSPAFVQDLKKNLVSLADRVAGAYIKNLGEVGSFICSPFKLDIQIALAVEYQRAREEKPLESCRLSDMVSNVEDFIEGNFKSGGWDDWITLTSKPGTYTPYGQLVTAQAAMRAKISNAQGEQLIELDWGQGFMSGKICEMIEGPQGPNESCVISKPGTVIAGSLNKALGAGQDQLVQADEINELVSALIGQLANQAITGAAGLLGLSAGTGHTYGGFDGGSYLNAAAAQSAQAAGQAGAPTTGGTAVTLTPAALTASIAVQNELVSTANDYIGRLNTYANNTSNPADKRSTARSLAQGAATARDRAIPLIPRIETIRSEFQTLETEKNQAATAAARKQEIATRQVQLQTQFTTLNPYTNDQLNTFKQTWQAALN